MRMDQLGDRTLWFDEAYSCRMIEYPVSSIVNLVRYDTAPAGYYLVLKVWGGVFGHSVVSLRGMSVVSGLLAIIGMYLFVRALYVGGEGASAWGTLTPQEGRRAALLTAALVALSVWQIRYGWEARFYALGTALLAFSSWALVHALRGATPLRWWLLYSGLTLLFLYTHYFALFSVAAQVLFILGVVLVRAGWNPAALVRQKTFWQALLAGGIIALGLLPGLPVFLFQRSQVQESFWIPPLSSIWNVLSAFYHLFIDPDRGASQVVYACLGAGCLLGLLVLAYRPRAAEWYLLLAGLLPLVLAGAASLSGLRIFYPRYFTFAHLFLLAGLAVVVVRCRWTLVWIPLASLLLITFLWADFRYKQELNVRKKSGSLGAAAYLEKQRQQGEPVVVATGEFYLPIYYHTTRREGLSVYRQPGADYVWGESILRSGEIVAGPDLQRFTSGRVWVVNVLRGNGKSDSVPVPPLWKKNQTADFAEPIGLNTLRVVGYTVPETGKPGG
jgi:uncharacterized membrane protein